MDIMQNTLNKNTLQQYVNSQLKYNFNDGTEVEVSLADIVTTLDKIEHCFNHIHLKYFYDKGPVFNHLYGDTYSMFLYFISREMYLRGEENGATKVFLLNKMMFGVDLFYTVVMPDIFYLSHPSGTVLGNAKYSDYLVVYQGVSVGSDLGEKGEGGMYPNFGEGTVLLANSTIIGNCNIGDNVTFGANSLLRNSTIESNKIVVNQWPNHRILPNTRKNSDHYFGK
jgi:serine O-acetyltransferase